MGLFSQAQLAEINKAAEQSAAALAPPVRVDNSKLITQLDEMSAKVEEYFSDSKSILISSEDALHDYISDVINSGMAGIDTETTGLDRLNDHVVGASLYFREGTECYIPNKHLIPLFDEPYRGQIPYKLMKSELQRLVDKKVKLVFANADFDLAMIYNSYGVDLLDSCYYDVLLAWRCLKENEPHNGLKELYNKYVLGGKGNPMRFSDFFTPSVFPYSKPEIAKLYAANDAKITLELHDWQLPYVTKNHPKCIKHHLEAISDLIWNVEIPMIRVCQEMHRRGIEIDRNTCNSLHDKYQQKLIAAKSKLARLVQEKLDQSDYLTTSKSPFKRGVDFNPNSSIHVSYLCKNILKLTVGKSLDKNVLAELNTPCTDQILVVRNLVKLISTYVDKLPKSTSSDSRIHATFNSVGADTGRMSSANPNLQNIPSHALDIRHMFRASSERNILLDCDESDSTISVTIPCYYYVTLESGEEIKCSDVQIGMRVKLLESKKEVIRSVINISDSSEEPALRTLVF